MEQDAKSIFLKMVEIQLLKSDRRLSSYTCCQVYSKACKVPDHCLADIDTAQAAFEFFEWNTTPFKYGRKKPKWMEDFES